MEEIILPIVLPQEVSDFLDYGLKIYQDVEVVRCWASYTSDYDKKNGTKVFNYLIDLDNRRNYFMAALTDCYEVEKEQLYYVKLQLYYVKFINSKQGYLNKGLKELDGKYFVLDKEENERIKTKFTEKEIKEKDERHWQSAVKAEDDDE